MDSRERTFLALDHQVPDRVPVDSWLSDGMKEKLKGEEGTTYQRFLDDHDVDLRYIPGPSYKGPSLEVAQPDIDLDIWGVSRRKVFVPTSDGEKQYGEVYREVVVSPLEHLRSVEEILDYESWPSLDWFDYDVIESQCDAVRNAGRVVVFMGDRLNRIAQLKPAMYLRGFEQLFVDMVETPEIARAIFDKIAQFYLEYAKRILETARGKIDILCTGDDFGTQTGPLISVAMWRDLLKEQFTHYIDMGHAYGAVVMHHTCGAVYPLLPEMVGCGLDVLQSLQPDASEMDPRKIKSEFGDRLCFQGGISIQKVLPRGSRLEVRKHVQTVLEALAPGGGYIAGTSHNVQSDTPLENLHELFRAYQEYGKY